MQAVLVYFEWFRRNSLWKCVFQAKIAKKSLKPRILGVQGRSRSSMFVPLESSSAVLVMIRSKSVSICNRFHARWANSGKITISKGGTPLWCHRLRGLSSPTGTKLPHRKLDTPGYHMVKTRSLYLTCAWYTTGSWQTDRIPIANTRSQQYLPVQLSRVKIIFVSFLSTLCEAVVFLFLIINDTCQTV